MKKHEMINGRLLQTNKSFSQLKQNQKLKINEWMYKEYRTVWIKKGKEPDKCDKDIIVNAVYDKIKEAEIWIPLGEIYKYYERHKNKFKKRYERYRGKTKEAGEP